MAGPHRNYHHLSVGKHMIDLVKKPKLIHRPGFFTRLINKMFGETKIIRPDEEPKLSQDKAIRLHIYYATGGRVIEVSHYDSNTGHHTNRLYIVTADQNFGEELDKILTMEHLRHI